VDDALGNDEADDGKDDNVDPDEDDNFDPDEHLTLAQVARARERERREREEREKREREREREREPPLFVVSLSHLTFISRRNSLPTHVQP
jgi:hypothetical protein